VIVKMDAGGNDIWFGSEESARKPQLIVETVGVGAAGLGLSSYAIETVDAGETSDSAVNDGDQLMSSNGETGGRTALQRMVYLPPRLRVARLGPTEIELGWEVDLGASCEIQVQSSVSGGEWTTVFTTADSTGSVRIPITAGNAGAYFRIVRVD
jgi:hypothetical protein